MPDTWVTDLTHLLDSDGRIPKDSPARALAKYFAAIVAAVTEAVAGSTEESDIKCRRRPNRRPCPGRIGSGLQSDGSTIAWECPECGDRGFLSNWQNTHWNKGGRGSVSERCPAGAAENTDTKNSSQQLDKFADLTWQDLEEWTGSKIVSRGKSYKKRVRDLCVTAKGGLVATVSGTHLYTTRVDRKETGDLLCSCTCPYDWGPCKHGVGVILAALDTLKGKRCVPVAAPDDARLGGRPEITAEDLPYDDRDEVHTRDDVEFPESRSEPTLAGHSQTHPKLREYMSRLLKRELTELVFDLVTSVPEAREWMSDRIRFEADDVYEIKEVVEEIRQQITALASEPAWTDDWSGDGHVPDYSGILERLEALLAAGHADEVVSLGDDLLRLGIEQIEMSSDDGDVGMEIAECMAVVFRAVVSSSMSRPEQLLWEIDALLQDDYGILDDVDGPQSHAELYSPEDWCNVADTLAARLQALSKAGDDKKSRDFLHDFHRQVLMRVLASALESAGRHAEVVSLLEREVAVTGCYTDLVDHLVAIGRTEDAGKWALTGFEDTIENLPGVAWGLEERLRNMAEQSGDVRLVAAYRAIEFFRRPDVGSYVALHEASESAGVWADTGRTALRFLETGELPQELSASSAGVGPTGKDPDSSSWPLPSTGLRLPIETGRTARFPSIHDLVEVAIHERRYDDVVKWYARTDSSHGFLASGLGDKVASAVKLTHPEISLAIWRENAEEWIAQVNRSAYEAAGKYLNRIAALYQELGRSDEWSAYLNELRKANKRRPRMMEVLDSIGGKRRRILDGSDPD